MLKIFSMGISENGKLWTINPMVVKFTPNSLAGRGETTISMVNASNPYPLNSEDSQEIKLSVKFLWCQSAKMVDDPSLLPKAPN